MSNGKMSSNVPADMINLRLILVSGKTKEFLFSPNDSASDIAKHVYDNWPMDWEEEQVSSPNILRLIYQGRFLHGNVTLGDGQKLNHLNTKNTKENSGKTATSGVKTEMEMGNSQPKAFEFAMPVALSRDLHEACSLSRLSFLSVFSEVATAVGCTHCEVPRVQRMRCQEERGWERTSGHSGYQWRLLSRELKDGNGIERQDGGSRDEAGISREQWCRVQVEVWQLEAVMAGEGAPGGTGEKAFKTERADDIRAKVPGTQEVITCK
ncbi:hypothetical protein JEQ12_002121 [Ovis aries]|uniref:Ubiquitin-like protein 3 n=1 Tax=Ovis aries TaxID=9940 RepID=A0A836A2H8_SHEEP|nr:hypothetical protein JEQ12_002121 [Ovis aries]